MKKSNGEGTIYKQKKNGKIYYRGQITIGYDPKGNLKRKSFSGANKKEVLKRMNEFQYNINTGQMTDNEDITLQEWYHRYLFDFRINDLKPASFERYETVYRVYIKKSNIGKMKIKDIQMIHLQKYFNSLLKEKPASLVNNIKKYLSIAMKEAERQNYIIKNHCSNIKLPRAEKKNDFSVFTKSEQNKFLEVIKGHKFEVLYKLDLGTGLRLGEIIALKWTDIDFINGTLKVNKSLRRITFIDENGNRENKITEQTPKTENSIRTVPIPENIIKQLKSYRKEQLEYIITIKDIYNDLDLIFCDKIGNPHDPKKISRNFKSILKKHDLREIKFHSIRHTYATRLFEAGVPIKTVQVLLGHSDITTTMNIYTHVMKEEKSKAAESINNLFNAK